MNHCTRARYSKSWSSLPSRSHSHYSLLFVCVLPQQRPNSDEMRLCIYVGKVRVTPCGVVRNVCGTMGPNEVCAYSFHIFAATQKREDQAV